MTIYISVFEKSALSPSSLPLLCFFSPLPPLPPSPGDESEGYLFVPFHYKEEKRKYSLSTRRRIQNSDKTNLRSYFCTIYD